MIKLLIDGTEVPFETTKFPDNTSQVWKLKDADIEYDKYSGDPEILWMFESEDELMHVLQLAHLAKTHFDAETLTLVAPYLPYGRQDKEVSNASSFALNTFKETLYHAGICRIESFDPHSQSEMVYPMGDVRAFHRSVIAHDVICYPDKGAATRYGSYDRPTVYCEKVRDQLTGNITGLKVISDVDLTGKSVLIVDDICDGGMTFIKVTEALQQFKPKQVDLAVSHGLWSKGKECLHEAGITNLYTTNSLLRNPDGFKVW